MREEALRNIGFLLGRGGSAQDGVAVGVTPESCDDLPDLDRLLGSEDIACLQVIRRGCEDLLCKPDA